VSDEAGQTAVDKTIQLDASERLLAELRGFLRA
jgi:hypothetical protein